MLGADHARRVPPLTGPYTQDDSFHEPLTLIAFYSAITTNIGFATGVLVLPQRQTALVAKQAAQIALMSGGRIRLGVGVGWNYVEYEALEQEFGNRGRRQEEQVDVLRRLWSEDVIDFDGKWHRIDRAGIRPRPAGPIPIWFGGGQSRPAAYERAARLGDGFIFSRSDVPEGANSPQSAASIVRAGRELRAMVVAARGENQVFGMEARTNYAIPVDRWVDEIEVFANSGFEYLTLNTMNAGLRADQHIAALARYASIAGLPR